MNEIVKHHAENSLATNIARHFKRGDDVKHFRNWYLNIQYIHYVKCI